MGTSGRLAAIAPQDGAPAAAILQRQDQSGDRDSAGSRASSGRSPPRPMA